MSNDGHFPSIFGRVQATQISGGKKKKREPTPRGRINPSGTQRGRASIATFSCFSHPRPNATTTC